MAGGKRWSVKGGGRRIGEELDRDLWVREYGRRVVGERS